LGGNCLSTRVAYTSIYGEEKILSKIIFSQWLFTGKTLDSNIFQQQKNRWLNNILKT
jgi:hypothetical protein